MLIYIVLYQIDAAVVNIFIHTCPTDQWFLYIILGDNFCH